MSDDSTSPVPLADRWARDERPVTVVKAPERPPRPPVDMEEPTSAGPADK